MKKLIMIFLTGAMAMSFSACTNSDGLPENGSTVTAQNSTEQVQVQNESEVNSKTENKNEQSAAVPDTETDDTTAETDNDSEGSNILVAYFSVTNNTEGIAQKLADGLGADLYEITPEQPYTAEDLDYNNSGSRSTIEMNDPSTRPEISGSVENMEQYDVVLIGYPIWWGEAPRIMSTFVESYDFSGKTLAAFCTSASSGFGSSDSALRSAANGAEWLDGQRFSADASADEIISWADGLGI